MEILKNGSRGDHHKAAPAAAFYCRARRKKTNLLPGKFQKYDSTRRSLRRLIPAHAARKQTCCQGSFKSMIPRGDRHGAVPAATFYRRARREKTNLLPGKFQKYDSTRRSLRRLIPAHAARKQTCCQGDFKITFHAKPQRIKPSRWITLRLFIKLSGLV
jgi:hypothetical protein